MKILAMNADNGFRMGKEAEGEKQGEESHVPRNAKSRVGLRGRFPCQIACFLAV
jgi:hypothetical protein